MAALVKNEVRKDPFTGTVFVFRSRRTDRQKLIKVQIPLALPNIMAGVNQTIMMSLAMVVIASLVSAPGLGVLVLRGIRNLELGVGLVSGLGIVILAVILDRTTKLALARINTNHE